MKKNCSVNVPQERNLYRELLYILFFIGAIVCGCIYSVSMRENDILLFTINQYITVEYDKAEILNLFKNSLITYGLSFIIIFIGGLNKVLLPLSILGFFYTVFSYSFTMTCFLLLYGAKGILVGFLVMGIQAMIIISLLIDVGYQGLQFSLSENVKDIKSYAQNLTKGGVILIVVSTIDSLLQPLMHYLALNII
ncbi:hypothetical protein AN639_08945 [Candidatus Epulonipiscium fishelsonii]|uniref:Uncharacterized protein n=1 Tax=Candidatus Epulonipiscium fishelsonii TaxID=77094 RepID=A0ACC8XDS9_9FIRM|nr:hypothetical protein AN639_08945 [Epulopiscium sp. SCG-B05WGA-EpuloA1]ONI40972.1 hypothetical protein AN396_04230 [Epulopiscium sp. SCG-B11WGA-EpuloA1]ONI47738.1 hypothetical protein AN644_04095 [Epulopiscium sp. SCG-C06WGA-EpuloA1]